MDLTPNLISKDINLNLHEIMTNMGLRDGADQLQIADALSRLKFHADELSKDLKAEDNISFLHNWTALLLFAMIVGRSAGLSPEDQIPILFSRLTKDESQVDNSVFEGIIAKGFIEGRPQIDG